MHNKYLNLINEKLQLLLLLYKRITKFTGIIMPLRTAIYNFRLYILCDGKSTRVVPPGIVESSFEV